MGDAEDIRKRKNEADKKELERQSNDEILVYNPRTEDFDIKWGGYTHKVPHRDKDIGYGKGCLVIVRYLAKKYISDIVDLFINEANIEHVAKEKKRYRGGHWPEEEQKIGLRTDNVKLRREYMKGLWKGVYKRFGLDEVPKDIVGKPEDKRPLDDRLIEEMEADMEKEVGVEAKKTELKPVVKAKKKTIKDDLAESVKEEDESKK